LITFDGIGREESQVLSLQWVFVSELWASGLRLGFSRERRVVHFELTRFDDSDIGGYSVTEFDFDNVSDSELFSFQVDLLSISDGDSELRDHVLE